MSRYDSPKFGESKPSNRFSSRYSSISSGLVQISGPGRHTYEIPSVIAQRFFSEKDAKDQHGQLQLILGMKSNGATELLIPADISPVRPTKYMAYKSVLDTFRVLSPITFAMQKAFENFLVLHMPQKKRPWSKANKGYETSQRKYDEDSETERCSYEYCRLIIRHITNTLPRSPQVYGILNEIEGGWIGQTAGFLLLTFNDYRALSEKGFLDAAWGIVDPATLDANKLEPENIKPIVKQDFDFGQTLFWGAKGNRSACKHLKTTEGEDISECGGSLRQYIQSYYTRAVDEQTSLPLFVVVHSWSQGKSLLSEMGIETNSWVTRLAPLLRSQKEVAKRENGEGGRSRSASSSFGQHKRERSLSPSRQIKGSSKSKGSSARPQIYVIDTKLLYSLVRRSGNLPEGLIDACKDFEMAEVDDVNGWCSGNELQLLWVLFIKMATGPTIDEMFESMFKNKFNRPDSDDSDEDEEDEGGIHPSASDGIPLNSNSGRNQRGIDLSDDEDGLVSD